MVKKRLLFFSCLAGMILAGACVSNPPPQMEPAGSAGLPENGAVKGYIPERRLLRTEPESAPAWKNTPPASGEEIYFIGVSRFLATAAEARNDARENAFIQVMRFYGEFIQSTAVERSSIKGSSAETLAALVDREEELTNFAQAVVSQVGTGGYYTEIYLNGENREEYVVYALCQIPRQKAEQDIADFARNTSERYANLLAAPSNLRAVLLLYGEILTALEQNPLHRMVAYYDSPGGRVNLYEYLSLQLNTLAAGVSFASLPSMTVEKTGTLTAMITVLSPFTGAAGALDCAVSIYGMNNSAPTVKYAVGVDNSFLLTIFSSRLEPGRYTVQLELLLGDVNPRIRRNPSVSFSFEVRPLTARVDVTVAGDIPGIGDTEKAILIQSVQQGIQSYGVPVNLTAGGTEQSIFTITLGLRRQAPVPPLNRELIICDTVISFSRNGLTRESASTRVTEIDIPGMVNQIRRFISENEAFFQNVAGNLLQ
jgi:hypothetical protein